MRVLINNNVLKVVTNIAVAAMGSCGVVEKPATKETPAYKVFKDDAGQLSKYGLGYNTIEDGKAAVTIVLPMEVKDGDYKKYVKEVYGSALRAAMVTDEIAATIAAEDAELEAIMNNVTVTAAPEAIDAQ